MLTAYAESPDVVLGPLRDRPEADWWRAPAGKWAPAQIVEHLALAFEWSIAGFEKRRAGAPMSRRPRTWAERIATFAIFGLEWIPPGVQAPGRAWPQAHPDPREVERRFLAGHARLGQLAAELLPARATDLYVKHPRMGDLTIEEWLRFHAWHCRHHAKQVRARLAR